MQYYFSSNDLLNSKDENLKGFSKFDCIILFSNRSDKLYFELTVFREMRYPSPFADALRHLKENKEFKELLKGVGIKTKRMDMETVS